jgi:hypothetical protein
MTRTTTGLCVAAALGLAVTLGAQTSSPSNPDQRYPKSSEKAGHEVSVTGCLTKGADGNFMLTNARIDTGSSSTSTTAGTTGTTGAPPTTTTAEPAPSASSADRPMTWKLEGGKDLDKHVGHKIQVTGRTSWEGSTSPGSTASAAPPPPSTTTAAPPTTTGTTGAVPEEQRERGKSSSSANEPRLDVQSIKMIASSCS